VWSAGAYISVKNMLKMPALHSDIVEVRTAQDCMDAAQKAELVGSLDHTITAWCKEIENVRSLRCSLQTKLYIFI